MALCYRHQMRINGGDGFFYSCRQHFHILQAITNDFTVIIRRIKLPTSVFFESGGYIIVLNQGGWGMHNWRQDTTILILPLGMRSLDVHESSTDSSLMMSKFTLCGNL